MSTYTDYHVCARVTFNNAINGTALISRYPLANSSEMATHKCETEILNEYGADYINDIEIVHCLRLDN
ncbi:hypothetical protein [Alteromonas phage JH01]|nr:hypothetical protein [Alteromonas phage JH01]